MDVSGAYQRRIGTYQSCQDTPIRQLEYQVRIARESSDARYVGNGPNLGNPSFHAKDLHDVCLYIYIE
jgi:hypothetical protein